MGRAGFRAEARGLPGIIADSDAFGEECRRGGRARLADANCGALDGAA